MAAKRDEEDPAAPSGGDDSPDWTTWLRSRLERVSNSEREAADSVQDVPEEVAGGDPPQPEGPVPQGHAAPKSAPAAPAPPPAPGSARSAPTPAPAPVLPAPTPAPVLPAVAASTSGSEVDALRAAVTALVAGVGALADTFSGFRTTVTERLDEYRETLLRATTDTATELEAHRQVHAAATDKPATDEPDPALAEVNVQLQRLAAGIADLTLIRTEMEAHRQVHAAAAEPDPALAEVNDQLQRLSAGMDDVAAIRTELEAHRQVHAAADADADEPDPALGEVNDQLQRLAAGIDHVAAIRGDDERWAEVMGRLLDEVDAERQATEQERSVTGGVIERLEGLEQAVQGIATDVAENVAGQQRIATELAEMAEAYPGFTAEWAQFVEGQERLAGYVAQIGQAQQGVTAEVTHLVLGQQRIVEDVAELARAQQRQADEVTQMALAQRASAEAEAVLEGVVRDAAIEQRPPSPVRSPAPPGRRRAPLRADRQSAPPGRSR